MATSVLGRAPKPPKEPMPILEPSQDARDLLGLFPTAPARNILEEFHVGLPVILCSVTIYACMLAGTFAGLAEHKAQLLPLERTAALAAGTVLLASALARVGFLVRNRKTLKPTMADMAMLAANTMAASANLIMGTVGTPILVDPITGTSEYMVRWCEWGTLGFLMTFTVEAVSARALSEPLSLGVLMGTACVAGYVFPFCSNIYVWGAAMVYAFAAYSHIFPRYLKRRRTHQAAYDKCASPSDVAQLVAEKVAHQLMVCCLVMWTIITADYCVTAALAYRLGDAYGTGGARPQWPFVLDCCLDVVAKLCYAAVVSSAHAHVPVEAEKQQTRWIREAMDTVWSGARDAVLLSELRGNGTVRTIASDSLSNVVPKAAARRWTTWHAHYVGGAASWEGSEDTLSSHGSVSSASTAKSSVLDAQEALETLISSAWHQSIAAARQAASRKAAEDEFGAELYDEGEKPEPPPAPAETITMRWEPPHRAGAAEGTLCEVQATRCTRRVPGQAKPANFLIVVIRDITERVRTIELERKLAESMAEKRLLAEQLGRRCDDHAARFTQQEARSGVLSALAQCEALIEFHVQTEASFKQMKEGNMEDGLRDLAAKLQRTLGTVNSAGMAKHLANGTYEPHAQERVDVAALLSESLGRPPRFSLRAEPSAPSVFVDPQLLVCVHRNAIANALEFGCRESPIATSVRLRANGMLVLRVTNAPGPGHEKLMADGGAVSKHVFERGATLHGASARSEDGPKGDGGWIMRLCADALGGKCSIAFEPDGTVFELSCPVGVDGPPPRRAPPARAAGVCDALSETTSDDHPGSRSEHAELEEIQLDVRRAVGRLTHDISSTDMPWADAKRALGTIKAEVASLHAVFGVPEERAADVGARVDALLELRDAPYDFRRSPAWLELLASVHKALGPAAPRDDA